MTAACLIETDIPPLGMSLTTSKRPLCPTHNEPFIST